MSEIKFKKMNADATVPTYSKVGDAGADLSSCEDVIITPGNWALVSTGIAISMPSNFVGLVHPRSGLAARLGVTVLNSPGTVDSGYRGVIMVNLINHGSIDVKISKGDRIAQIVFQKFERVTFTEVTDLDETDRGSDGHGSTGGYKDAWI